MSEIFDEKLYKTGEDKIRWVESYMPILTQIRERFRREKPFDGIRISTSIHLEAKTAMLIMTLKDGGATVFASGCNTLSTQDDVAAALVNYGAEVFAVHGEDDGSYRRHLTMALSQRPDLIIDDGGDFISLLHSEAEEFGSRVKGGCEETTTGIMRLRSMVKKKALKYPMININDASCKHFFDNRYGTGQSTFDAIMHTTNLIVASKTVVVAGYGWCGRGIAMRARGLGADVIVTEIDPVKAIEAVMDGFRVMPMIKAAEEGDLFITATGDIDVITKKHLARMKDGVLLCNSGHFNVEISIPDLEALSVEVFDRKPGIRGYRTKDGRVLNLLAEGKLVNLAAGNGHPAEIMDLSFSLQALCLEHLVKHAPATPGLYPVPDGINSKVAELYLKSRGIKLDRLTAEQKKYIS